MSCDCGGGNGRRGKNWEVRHRCERSTLPHGDNVHIYSHCRKDNSLLPVLPVANRKDERRRLVWMLLLYCKILKSDFSKVLATVRPG